MNWRVRYTDRPRRVAILVSKYAHCLLDLLWRWEAGELDAEIPLVISNHPDLAEKVQAHGIPFHHLPVAKGAKAEQEAQVVELLKEHEIDLVVLARYMQILSAEFLDVVSAGRSSTSTTRSCRRSSGPARTTRPMPAG